MIKVIILKHSPDTYLVGNIQELDEEPSLLVEDVFQITPDGEMEVYPLHTTQRYVFLTSTDVMTMMDPSPSVLSAHKKVVNE